MCHTDFSHNQTTDFMKITLQNYQTLQQAYDFFNNHLFNGDLPQCLITYQRQNGSMGYYAPNRFRSMRDHEVTTDEIALNPMHFVTSSGDKEIMQTLNHEMCHLWQNHFGKPSRKGYHNREWADKMISIGLIPSSTGAPGGRQVGQRIADYAEPNGRFERSFHHWSQNHSLEWADHISFIESGAIPTTESVEEQTIARKKTSKHKFVCPECSQNAWAKPTAALICGICIDNAVIHMEMQE